MDLYPGDVLASAALVLAIALLILALLALARTRSLRLLFPVCVSAAALALSAHQVLRAALSREAPRELDVLIPAMSLTLLLIIIALWAASGVRRKG
ncbi:MAG: hypothetical protein QXH42_03180 [Thermoplasmata archaeon]